MKALREDISTDWGEESQPRDICKYTYRIVAAFEVAEYVFLEALIKKAVHAVTTAVKEIGEEAVFKRLRLIGAITCPSPDRHLDVVKHCLWPVLSGPFKEMLEDSIATEMRTWLRNAYPVVPADRECDVAAQFKTHSGVDLLRRVHDQADKGASSTSIAFI